jgi:hypothetical protein
MIDFDTVARVLALANGVAGAVSTVVKLAERLRRRQRSGD